MKKINSTTFNGKNNLLFNYSLETYKKLLEILNKKTNILTINVLVEVARIKRE